MNPRHDPMTSSASLMNTTEGLDDYSGGVSRKGSTKQWGPKIPLDVSETGLISLNVKVQEDWSSDVRYTFYPIGSRTPSLREANAVKTSSKYVEQRLVDSFDTLDEMRKVDARLRVVWLSEDVETDPPSQLQGSFVWKSQGQNGELPSWVKELYDATAEEEVREAVALLYGNMNQILGEKNFDKVDDILRRVKLNKLPDALKVGLLRITYPAREYLDAWKDTLENVRSLLEAEGEDWASLLRGLV